MRASPNAESPDIFLQVGGLDEVNKTHPLWIAQRKLAVGDEIHDSGDRNRNA